MPDASRLQARLDLQVLLPQSELASLTGFATELVRIQQISPASATWTRNLPAVADELEVTISAALLPVDLRLIEGARVLFWLYEHQTPERCAPGDAGFFFGIVDEVGRERPDRTISLTCRDMTAVLLDAKVTPDELRRIDVAKAPTLADVVRRLLAFGGPFASDWRVVSVSPSAGRSVYRSFTKAVRGVKQKPGVTKAPPGRQVQRRQSTLDTLADGNETSVWEVIAQLCARLGAVPEIVLGQDGTPEVHLIDALDLQTSDALRPFSRAGRTARVLTIGRTVATVSESIRLTREAKLPDQVVVATWDHETGRMAEVAFPPDAALKRGSEKPRRVYQIAEGVSDLATLERLAAGAWAAMQQRQLELSVETWSPWSDGGGPEWPDLLDLGAGAAMVLEVADDHGYQTRRERDAAFDQLPDEVLEAFRRAEARRPLSMMFQVGEVVHTYASGEAPDYSCRMRLNAFLGTLPGDS